LHGKQAKGRKAAEEFGKFRETLAIWPGAWGCRSDAVIGRSKVNGADHPYLVLEQINYLLSKVK
jgi:hypothetical protein